MISPSFNVFDSNHFEVKMPDYLLLTGEIKNNLSVRKMEEKWTTNL